MTGAQSNYVRQMHDNNSVVNFNATVHSTNKYII